MFSPELTVIILNPLFPSHSPGHIKLCLSHLDYLLLSPLNTPYLSTHFINHQGLHFFPSILSLAPSLPPTHCNFSLSLILSLSRTLSLAGSQPPSLSLSSLPLLSPAACGVGCGPGTGRWLCNQKCISPFPFHFSLLNQITEKIPSLDQHSLQHSLHPLSVFLYRPCTPEEERKRLVADDDDVGKTEDFSCPSSVCGFGVERCITKGPASILLAICRKDV